MAKEKKAETLVSVEMTEAQKQEYADFCVEKERNAKKAEEVKTEQMVQVNLRFTHMINGHRYAGKKILPEGLACLLAYNDELAMRARFKESTADKHMLEILGNGSYRNVPVPAEGILS